MLRLQSAPHVSGTVRENGRPLAGVRVQAATSSPPSSSEISFSDANGSFSLARVPASRVAFKVQDYEVLEPKNLVVPVSGVRDVLLQVASMGSLAGRVTMARRPMTGALVHLEGGGYKETRSEADGNFVLRGMAPGNYTLFAESGEAAGRLSGVILAAGEARTGLDIELNRSGAIAGVVLEANGSWLMSATPLIAAVPPLPATAALKSRRSAPAITFSPPGPRWTHHKRWRPRASPCRWSYATLARASTECSW